MTYNVFTNNYEKGAQGQQTQSHDKNLFIAVVDQYTLYICTVKWYYCENLNLKRLGMRVVICEILHHHQARQIKNQRIIGTNS